MTESNYTSSNISVLEGLEPVRKRPGMYIGSTGVLGLHHLVWEILDNAIDECMAGYATEVKINITNDGAVVVEDDGRGIPTEIHEKTGISTVETVFTVLHAGGKFDASTYKVSGGLHGVGASVVNALSKFLEVEVTRNGKIYYARFENGGNIIKPLHPISDAPEGVSGTKVKFTPDFTIMEKNEFDYNYILDRAKQVAYLNKGLKISVSDERTNKTKTFKFDGGIIDYVKELNRGQKTIHNDIIYSKGEKEFTKEGVDGQNYTKSIDVEVAMQYTDKNTDNIVSYCNNIITNEGGTHVTGFVDALTRILYNYASDKNLLRKETVKFTREDVVEGLVAIISIKLNDALFEGQTKSKLGNKEARSAVNAVISEQLERFLDENPADAKLIVEKTLFAQKNRLAMKAFSETQRKKAGMDSLGLPGKLADCSSKNAEISELYIVEGNSAGGSAKMGRDRNTQAILPLRGKVINSEKSLPQKVLANEEIKSLIYAFGTGIGEDFNINKLRYHKIIIMTDADVDGAHIRTLLLTFFYRFFKPLIEYGFVYIAQPPLYKIQQNKNVFYAYNDAEKENIMATLNPNVKVNIQRYKGLGEMDPEQLWETTMDPQVRKMLQVQIEDAANADWAFTTLMGDDVLPRKEFIEENAIYVKNIDI